MLLSSIIGIFSFILILFFVIFSESCVPETRNAVMMFLNTVLPTMFPFYVLSSLIVSGRFLTRIAKPVKPLIYVIINKLFPHVLRLTSEHTPFTSSLISEHIFFTLSPIPDDFPNLSFAFPISFLNPVLYMKVIL